RVAARINTLRGRVACRVAARINALRRRVACGGTERINTQGVCAPAIERGDAAVRSHVTAADPDAADEDGVRGDAVYDNAPGGDNVTRERGVSDRDLCDTRLRLCRGKDARVREIGDEDADDK